MWDVQETAYLGIHIRATAVLCSSSIDSVKFKTALPSPLPRTKAIGQIGLDILCPFSSPLCPRSSAAGAGGRPLSNVSERGTGERTNGFNERVDNLPPSLGEGGREPEDVA